jgi:hydrogenase maturation protein HypF
LLADDKMSILRKLLPSSPTTSSLGRVLDAVSCYLGIGCERTYDGEPAMRLERYLDRGKPTFGFETDDSNEGSTNTLRVVRVSHLFRRLHELASKMKLVERTRADLAHSFVKSIVEKLADIALEQAGKEGLKGIGITGGVAYNIPINEMVRKRAEARGMELFTHDRLPPGDGGISAGQNVIAGMRTLDPQRPK